MQVKPPDWMQAVQNLANVINVNTAIYNKRFEVLLTIIEENNPGSREKNNKEMFRQQCYHHFLNIEQARRGSRPDALQIIKVNTEALEALKALAKERDWKSAYKKAGRDAAHFAEEQNRPEPPILEVVK